MIVLTDNRREPQYQPTGQNMLAAFHWLVSNNNPGDSLFLHYSGHGECWLYLQKLLNCLMHAPRWTNTRS